MFGVLYGKRFDSEMACTIRTEGGSRGAGQSTETSCEGSRLTLRPTGGCVKGIGRVGVGRGCLSYLYLLYLMCICYTMCVLLFLR